MQGEPAHQCLKFPFAQCVCLHTPLYGNILLHYVRFVNIKSHNGAGVSGYSCNAVPPDKNIIEPTLMRNAFLILPIDFYSPTFPYRNILHFLDEKYKMK